MTRNTRVAVIAAVAVTAAAGVAVAVGSVGSGDVAAKGLVREPGACAAPFGAPSPAGGAARTPPNANAYIFNNFGDNSYDTTLEQDLAATLGPSGEHYTVTMFDNPTEGRQGPGSATLTNFLSMACGGIVVIDSHATDRPLDPALPNFEAVPGTKGITRSTGQVSLGVGGVVVEWWQTHDEALSHAEAYVKAGVQPGWMFLVCADRITGIKGIVPVPLGACGTGTRSPTDNTGGWGIGLTAGGIAHFFKGHQIGILYVVACHSLSLAPLFDAASYFGYSDLCFARDSTPDGELLFDRLAGRDTLDRRTSVAAFGADGFRGPLSLAAGARPVTLSPAVSGVEPGDGASLAPGQTTTAEVSFDTTMRRTALLDLVKPDGCDARVSNGRWLDEQHLEFDIQVPNNPPPGGLVLRIDNTAAVAAPGFANRLDGNERPAGSHGAAPNQDDYLWHLSCRGAAPTTTVTSAAPGGVTVEYSGRYTEMAYNEFDNRAAHDPTTWNLTWDAVATADEQGTVTSSWHYKTLTGSIQTVVTVGGGSNGPTPCSVTLAEAPGFESTADDEAGITPAGGHQMLVTATIPFLVNGLVAINGTATGNCVVAGGFPLSVPAADYGRFNDVRAPKFTAPLGQDAKQDFNYVTIGNPSDGSASVNLTSTITITGG